MNIINIEKNNQIFNICQLILNSEKIKFTTENLLNIINSHIEYPSILTLKDTLSEYGFQSVAVRKGTYSYEEFETPFVCSIQKGEWSKASFTVVTKVENKQIEYLNPNTGKITSVSETYFGNIDKNIILLLDRSAAKNETNFLENRRKQLKNQVYKILPLYLFGIALLSQIYYYLSNGIAGYWYNISYIITSATGLVISFSLLRYDIGSHSPFMKEVCSGKSKKVNCNAVLSSPQSNFMGISWSIWGFSYFTTLFVIQLFSPMNTNFRLISSLFSLIAIPYIPFSIYLQWRVIKQWCPLCLAIVTVLIINVILSVDILNYINLKVPISYYSLIITLLMGLFILFVTQAAIPLIKKAKDSYRYKKKWERLRYNPEIFHQLLNKSESITYPVDNLGIVIGNPDATNEIIKVCNPYCNPCSKAQPELEHIIKNNIDVKIRVIFTASGEEDDPKTRPVAHLLAIEQGLGKEAMHQALNSWYLSQEKDYNIFAEKYPINIKLNQQTERIRRMRDWCNKMKIRVTPTIYINGRKLPDSYKIKELKNFL